MRALTILLAALLLAACTGGDGGLADGLAQTAARYQVLDLVDGSLVARGDIDNLVADGSAFDRYLVFRLIDQASAQEGASAGQLGAGLDPAATMAAQAPYYIAVTEVTRAHWAHLHGSQPWTLIDPPALAGDLADDRLPVTGCSFDQVSAVLAAASAGRRWELALPSARQWQYACAANASFAWGALADVDLARQQAVILESGVDGPQPVAGLQPNRVGLYDVHGNAREFDAAGQLHGGSWNDPVSTARASASLAIEPDAAHALSGVRPVLRPFAD